MPCIECAMERGRLPLLAVALLLLSACGTQPPASGRASTPVPPTPAAAASTSPIAARDLHLPEPAAPRTKLELERQFALRLVQAHPDTSYLTPTPERLWAIPVLEIELNADGSVRRIDVLRHPSTGDEATKLAIAAVRRAAPYGNVSRLPRPWKVVETFLFDDALRFKPRILDKP